VEQLYGDGEYWFSRLDAILDGGHCGIEPTTVVDLAVSPPVVVRQGRGKLAGVEWEVGANPV